MPAAPEALCLWRSSDYDPERLRAVKYAIALI